MGKSLAFHCISFHLTLNFLFDDEAVEEYMYLHFELVKIGLLFRGSCAFKIDVNTRTHERKLVKIGKTC